MRLKKKVCVCVGGFNFLEKFNPAKKKTYWVLQYFKKYHFSYTGYYRKFDIIS